jgi:hypothetical protein
MQVRTAFVFCMQFIRQLGILLLIIDINIPFQISARMDSSEQNYINRK